MQNYFALIIFEDRMSQNTETEKPINFDEIRLDPISHIHRNNPQFIASLARGLELLRCFSANNQGLVPRISKNDRFT